MIRKTIATVCVVALSVGIVSGLFAGGNREREDSTRELDTPRAERIVVRGEVVAVRELNEDATELTIRTERGIEVIAEVPTRMARNLRIARGDRFASEERVLAREGERLRVQRFTIERGR